MEKLEFYGTEPLSYEDQQEVTGGWFLMALLIICVIGWIMTE